MNDPLQMTIGEGQDCFPEQFSLRVLKTMTGPSWKVAEQNTHKAWFPQLPSCYLPPKLLEINPQDSR